MVLAGERKMWRAARTGSPEVLRVSESSPDTAETSFRELDDVFLQTQTRIWLGEVLHVRFDEDVAISNMLADGELLFQVSKEVWKMLLRKYAELKHSKVHIYEKTSSGKSDGRYMPYPKVDSFLKICQILGLTGVDLFCPSDVVEKRDTRRVCMCIRSLSKKARLKKLNVPDFDIVTYTIVMPTNLVGGICRNLELSQCSSPSSNGSSPRIDSREICGQKILCGQHSQLYDLGSDEAESIFSDLEFESPLSSSSYNATSISDLVGETSHGAASVVAEEIVPKTGFKNTRQNGNHYEHVDRHHEKTFFSEAIGGCYNLSTRAAYTFQISSSSSNSLQNTDQDARPCFSEIGKRCSLLSSSRIHLEKFDDDSDFILSESEICKESVDSNQKNDKSGLKVEGMVDEVASGTSYRPDIGAASHVASSEHYHRIPGNPYDGMPSINDFDCSKIIPGNPPLGMKLEEKESLLYLEPCHFGDGKMSGFRNQMINKLNSIHARDLGVLDVMESSDILAFSASASEVVPGLDFYSLGLASSGKNILETKVETFGIADIIPCSTPACREGRTTGSPDESIREKKQVLCCILDAHEYVKNQEEPSMAPRLKAMQEYEKEIIKVEEEGENKDSEGRVVGKPGNPVLKSVVGVVTMVGALVLVLHLWQKRSKERNYGTEVPLQTQKLSTYKKQIQMGKPDSLYPGEKLKL